MRKAKTNAAIAAVAMAVAAAAACCANAQQPAPRASAPAFRSSFAPPPREAAPALKVTQGKPFSAGYVFIDGRYIKPPYRVERYGTVIRINGIQVTDQVIPWEEFVKTQAGAKVEKTEVAPPGAEGIDALVPEPAPEPEPEVPTGDISDIDDLFADAPAKPKTGNAARPRPAPRPRKPTAVVSYTMDGPFVPNDRTKAYVDKINAYRTKIDGSLRTGGYFFFGSRYSCLSGDSKIAERVIVALYGALKSNADYASFRQAVRQSDLSLLPEPLVEDLFRNRLHYTTLDSRMREIKERREFQKMINKANN